MRYFANATVSSPDAMRAGLLCQIVTMAEGRQPIEGVEWIADNGVFGGNYPGDDKYLAWLAGLPHKELCRFVVAPDVVVRLPGGGVVGDSAATLARSLPMLPRIRALGIPVAFVGQDGATVETLPWGEFDALFIGGSDDWKLGPDARLLIAEGKKRGKWVHMGRVNSKRRLQYAADAGCDSADGTYLVFGPDTNLPKLLRWVRAVNQPALWEA